VTNPKSDRLLALADLVGRKKEHDARTLKRQSVAMLRQGAGKGRKVLWVWDKAGVDFRIHRSQPPIALARLPSASRRGKYR